MSKKWNNCDPKRPLDIIYPSFYRVSNFMYHTIAKEKKYRYTNEDALKKYNSSMILSPHEVSYFSFRFLLTLPLFTHIHTMYNQF